MGYVSMSHAMSGWGVWFLIATNKIERVGVPFKAPMLAVDRAVSPRKEVVSALGIYADGQWSVMQPSQLPAPRAQMACTQMQIRTSEVALSLQAGSQAAV